MQYSSLAVLVLATSFAASVHADAVIDWNKRADAIVAESKIGTPPAIRAMAIVQTAVNDAVRGLTDAQAIEAAVAAANRETLAKLIPAVQPSIDAAYRAALALVPDGAAKSAGLASGAKAATAVLATRANDGASLPEAYRPLTTAGVYVPTTIAAVAQWPLRTPWLMTSAAQFRPGPPPALKSDAWAHDYNEVKLLGSRVSAKRTAEQGAIARFWEYSLPAIYHGVVRSVAGRPGRSPAQNAQLFAAVAQAMDDAMIAVFDAKYHYNLWRPATAIRNGDIDGNDATERDPSWTPFVEAPMHPEYPSGHSILAAAVGTVLKAALGDELAPVELTTTSPTASNAARHWRSIDGFVTEVSNARVWAGIHYRTATRIGEAMGQRIGELAATRYLPAP